MSLGCCSVSKNLNPQFPKPAVANYVLTVLVFAYILSFVDRNVLALLVGPIRAEFEISDFQFSLLHGFAFTLFYIVLGIPIGWMADRFNRKWIICSGVFLWSLMTCACGLMKSFPSLFVTRIGVGVGEAALSPPAYSLMSDYFSPGKLRWATAIFTMGITVGSGTSYMVGGWLYEQFVALGTLSYLGLSFKPWQMTFITVGVPGFLVVLLLLYVKEPVRQKTALDGDEALPFAETLKHFKRNWQAYTGLITSMSMMAVIGYGYLIWSPEFLLRTYNIPKSEGGFYLGLIFIFCGTAGTFAGAFFADKIQARGYQDANVRLIMIVASILIIPAVLMPLMPNAYFALAIYALITFLQYTHFGVGVAGLQLITPNRMRAQISAIMLFSTNLLGLGLGGTFVASFTDFLFKDDSALNYSLAIVGAIAYPLAAIAIALSLKHYRRAQKRLQTAI